MRAKSFVPFLLFVACISSLAGPSPRRALPDVISFEEKPPLVGMEGRLELLLPESGLKTKKPERLSDIHLRIASTNPRGKLIYYDLRYTGRVPGEYDLRDFLLTAAELPATNLPPLPVSISGILPEQHNGWLEEQAMRSPGLFGGYKNIAILAIVLWVLAFFVVYRFGRKPKTDTNLKPVARPPTFAERIRPLLERAAAGKLTADEKALLERMLITHWQHRLGLANKSGDEIIAQLRQHSEAGVLLRALEDWLHRPPGSVAVSVDSVLAPYRNMPAEEPVEVAR